MPSKMNVSAVRSTFANSIKRWRNHRGLTQEELAERADLHRTYISDVERGARNLSLESMDKLARALGISLPILFSPEETPGASGDVLNGSSAEYVDVLLIAHDQKEVDATLDVFAKARLANPIRVVADGAEALELFFGRGAVIENLKNPLSQVIFLDLNLPKVSGLEVLRQLKADRRTNSIPVVILAAADSERDILECKRLGAAAFINKPVSFHSLSKITPAINLVWALLRPAANSQPHPSQPTETP